MLWFVLSVLTALAMSSEGAWLKKCFSQLGPYEMGMYSLVYSWPLFIITLAFIPHPALDMQFWASFFASFGLNAVAYILYVKSIQIAPLSLTIPYLALTPGFMIITGRILLDEDPNLFGILGILISLIGGYILNLDIRSWSPLEPLRAAFRERGSRLMLAVSMIYSVSAVLDKKAILHSSPMFFGVFFYIVFSPALFFYLIFRGKISWSFWRNDPMKGMVAGILVFFHSILHAWAISLTKAAYMISVKRLSVVFSVLYGWLVFNEDNIRARLAGAAFMVAGAVLIALKG